MSFTVQHKRSGEAGKRPTATSLVEGQIGVNFNDSTPGLFFKTGQDNIVKVGPAALGNSPPTLSGSLASYCVGELWLDTTANVNSLNVWDGFNWRSVNINLSAIDQPIVPDSVCGYTIGTAALPWGQGHFCDIFTNDLNLSNKSKGGNDVDGTWGSYTIQEGQRDLFLINHRSGKKFRFVLEEVEGN